MHGSSTSEVEAAHFEGPASRVPGPACDRVVDYGGPDEHEDDAGEHAASVCCSADGEGGTILMSALLNHF